MTGLQQALRWLALACVGLPLASCSDEADKSRAGAAPQAEVAIVEVKAEKLPVVTELPGRVAPMVTADVRPRITGMVLKRVFEQGSTVKEGDVLYVIDPKPFEAKVAAAKAALDSAIAARELAQERADRQRELLQRGVTSKDNSDTAIATLAQSNADVDRTRADLTTAQLELQYTQIRAPISGKIGRALVTEGALVSPTSDVMATIQQIDPVYVDFTQPADSVIALKNALAQGKLQADESGSARLKLISAGGKPYPHDGRLLFSEASVNSATGQIILRGEFPNPEMNLLPGMYVRGRLEQAALDGALAVPEQAVQRNTAGNAQLYIVADDGKVQLRTVTLGWIVDGRWVVVKGLYPGDRVVVEGFQRIAPGAPVKTTPWTHPSLASTDSSDKG
ncbi:MexE family multidrug efflux RND transporter periplasmic adaptor subunit [Brucella endophytica]|uniref:MexE family multidrug efflux RND transporter periplasmic adaptor subunit n=1 Tax=Brucella endophytica TaxID=1963359 RepID=A0A916S6E9_9HYPH|nr:efflux RND transporter periplasmic adaptor subunit [Brucella endophytica]GGA83293.1 MexE family multidrug efflux RND transporter periplasmic adaptor subunit [Brucella endophytica]